MEDWADSDTFQGFEGYLAADQGKTLADNPYPVNDRTWAGKDWICGFNKRMAEPARIAALIARVNAECEPTQ